MGHSILRWAAAPIVIAMLALTGCGNGSSESSGGDVRAQTATGGGSQEALAAVNAAYEGSHSPPPSTGPAAQKDKSIWVISCTQAGPGCSMPTKGVQDAAAVLGWKVTVVDGKGDPGRYSAGIKQAVAAKADGIVLVAVDCTSVKAALTTAKQANVPVVGVYAYDCGDVNQGPNLLTASIGYGDGGIREYAETWGKLQADYIAAKASANPKIIATHGPEFVLNTDRDKGFRAELEKVCPDCDLREDAGIPIAAMINGAVAQMTQTLLAQHPDANVLVTAHDSMTQAIAPALKRVNRPELKTIGGEGYPLNMELIRQGIQTVAVGIPVEWMGWAGADALNRVFAGQPDIPDQGFGFTIIDKDHNLPKNPGENWEPHIDYKSAFKKVWAGSGT